MHVDMPAMRFLTDLHSILLGCSLFQDTPCHVQSSAACVYIPRDTSKEEGTARFSKVRHEYVALSCFSSCCSGVLSSACRGIVSPKASGTRAPCWNLEVRHR